MQWRGHTRTHAIKQPLATPTLKRTTQQQKIVHPNPPPARKRLRIFRVCRGVLFLLFFWVVLVASANLAAAQCTRKGEVRRRTHATPDCVCVCVAKRVSQGWRCLSRSENLYSEKREGRRDNKKLHETDKQQTMDRKYETEAWRIERIAAHEGRPGQHKEGLRVSERAVAHGWKRVEKPKSLCGCFIFRFGAFERFVSAHQHTPRPPLDRLTAAPLPPAHGEPLPLKRAPNSAPKS